jgi:hypothetical protein
MTTKRRIREENAIDELRISIARSNMRMDMRVRWILGVSIVRQEGFERLLGSNAIPKFPCSTIIEKPRRVRSDTNCLTGSFKCLTTTRAQR